MIKLLLLIDGNYLLHRVVHILHKNQLLTSELYNVMEKDYDTITRLYPFDKVYFISDSPRNWRKEFYPEHKGTRKQDGNIDWKFVYKEYNRFKIFLKQKHNCIQVQVDDLEGDDVIAYIVKKSNDKGESTFIMSHDSDILQLINYDVDKKCINIMYNSKMTDEKIYIPEYYNILMKKIKDEYVDDIFESSNDLDFLNFINDLINDKNIIYINSESELFMKIMGHNKDNIKSVFMKGDRGIGKNGIIKVYELYKQTYPEPIDFNSEIFKKRLIEHIKLHKRIKDNLLDDIMINRLNLNLKIVKLDKESMPSMLYERMIEEVII